MNQTARYVIMILLLIALGIWSITVYRSCQEIKEPIEEVDDTTDIDTSGLEDLYATEQDTTADEFIEEGQNADEDADEEPLGNYSEPKSTLNGGEFLVIAGAFIVEANAQKVVNRLNQKGYNDAEIRVFLGSEYHSAIVDDFDDMDDAFDVAIKLAEEGYKDVYVHKKRKRRKR